ncbi:YhfC family intramembrane metalloprotease [Ectobacillus panaciterrae]|uniref:YhfC family intramembrane metalloprotease n=1 Tax=Ectobacillus panaciterrae TaxID=363872 RepID=UPI000421363C|nr:YhfC family glutamic-type intramembrane protease [Ectobacillus panaciterrae]
MISQSAIIGLITQCVISVLIPVAAYVYLKKKYHSSFRPVLVGSIIFIGFSLILEGSMNAYLLTINKTTSEITKHPYWFTLYGALAAGVFEEIGRFVGFTILLKKYRERKDGLAYGLGHGGIEAIIIGGISGIQNIVYINLVNSGQFEALLGTKVPAEALAQLKASLLEITFTGGLLGGAERIAAFFIQVAFSLLVLYAVRAKKFQYVLLAIFLHTFVDYIALLHKTMGLNLIIVEGFIAFAGICAFLFIKKSRALSGYKEESSAGITY